LPEPALVVVRGQAEDIGSRSAAGGHGGRPGQLDRASRPAGRFVRVAFDRLDVHGQPEAAALRTVRRRIRAQGVRAGREGLFDLLKSSVHSLAGYRRLHRSALSEAGDYERARAELRRVLRRGRLGGASAERLEPLEQQLADAVDAEFIAPMRQAARETSDLVDRTRRLAAAELARVVFLTAPSAEVACGTILGSNTPGTAGSESSKRVTQFVRLTGQLCRILKEISEE
jgi:hypothetical protein